MWFGDQTDLTKNLVPCLWWQSSFWVKTVLKMSNLNADICCVWHCLICLKVSVCIFQFCRRLVLFSEVRLSSGLCFTSVLSHRTCGLTESSSPRLPSYWPLRLTPPAQMGSSGFWTSSKSVPKMGGTWPASTWASSPSSASWCPHFRKFVFQTRCSCTVRPSPAAQSVCLFVFCVQAVLQFLQDGQHGQRHLHLVPAAVVGRWHLQPGGLLPGRPAPTAGDWRRSCDFQTQHQAVFPSCNIFWTTVMFASHRGSATFVSLWTENTHCL